MHRYYSINKFYLNLITFPHSKLIKILKYQILFTIKY